MQLYRLLAVMTEVKPERSEVNSMRAWLLGQCNFRWSQTNLKFFFYFILSCKQIEFQLSKLKIKVLWMNQILQHCMESCCFTGLPLCMILPTKESSCQISAQSDEKWLIWAEYRFCSTAWNTALLSLDLIPSTQ